MSKFCGTGFQETVIEFVPGPAEQLVANIVHFPNVDIEREAGSTQRNRAAPAHQ